MSTRKAYGMALAKLGRYNERVVALDGDTKNFTCSEIFKNEHPNRYVECYIAQQNMVRGLWPAHASPETQPVQLCLCSALEALSDASLGLCRASVVNARPRVHRDHQQLLNEIDQGSLGEGVGVGGCN